MEGRRCAVWSVSLSHIRRNAFSVYEFTMFCAITGIPELNISALDPFYLDEYLLHYDSGDISGKCLFKNVNTYGLRGVKITDVR